MLLYYVAPVEDGGLDPIAQTILLLPGVEQSVDLAARRSALAQGTRFHLALRPASCISTGSTRSGSYFQGVKSPKRQATPQEIRPEG